MNTSLQMGGYMDIISHKMILGNFLNLWSLVKNQRGKGICSGIWQTLRKGIRSLLLCAIPVAELRCFSLASRVCGCCNATSSLFWSESCAIGVYVVLSLLLKVQLECVVGMM